MIRQIIEIPNIPESPAPILPPRILPNGTQTIMIASQQPQCGGYRPPESYQMGTPEYYAWLECGTGYTPPEYGGGTGFPTIQPIIGNGGGGTTNLPVITASGGTTVPPKEAPPKETAPPIAGSGEAEDDGPVNIEIDQNTLLIGGAILIAVLLLK